jgi:uncharacterized membrane protein YdjX (TVP38/TMEM64 family)
MPRPRTLAVAVVVSAILVTAWFVPVAEWIVELPVLVRETGALGVAIFFAAYIVATIALLPGSIFTLVAGFAWGPLWGLAIASPASVAGATSAFMLGRTLLRDWAARHVGRWPRARALDTAVQRNGFKMVFLLRLSPVFPFNLLNYALGLSGVSLGAYVLASFLGMLPATILYVYLGSLAPAAAELSLVAASGGKARMLLYLAGLLATVAAVVIGARAARRALDAELQTGSEGHIQS